MDGLSDSDGEEEAADQHHGSAPRRSLSPLPPRPTSFHSTRKTSVSGDRPDQEDDEREGDEEDRMVIEEDAPEGSGGTGGDEERTAGTGQTHEAVPESEASSPSVSAAVSTAGGSKREVGTDRPKLTQEGVAAGPKKTKVVVRDAAWSTWWAVLFWVSLPWLSELAAGRWT